MQLLIEDGVPAQRLVAIGFGRGAPRDRGSSRAAHARNRRVEFVLEQPRSTGRARVRDGYTEFRSTEVRSEEGSR